MIEFTVNIFQSYPQLAIFLALAIGYFVGKIKIFGFSLGSTAGVLLSAMLIGQMDIAVTPLLKTVAFALFIFAIGYKVGPQFFGALRKEGKYYIIISIVVALIALITAVLLAKLFGFDAGTTAGMLSGAMTQSTIIGTADGAIKQLSISAAEKAVLESNVAIAYAITYVFGVAGLIIFFKLVPKILRIDLKKEARELEAKLSGATDELSQSPELFSWYKNLNLRGYKVEKCAGKTVSQLEGMFAKKVAVEKIKRGKHLFEPAPDTILERSDEIAMVGDRHKFLKAEQIIGPEIDDRQIVNIVGEIMDVCMLKPEVVGKTLGQIKSHGCFLRKMTRQGHELPLTRGTMIHKCDVLQVAGAQKDVENFIKNAGYPERPTNMTDLIAVGLGCVAGTLVGLIAVPLFGIPLTLGIGGGVLLAGLVCGWLRAVHPTFGQIPGSAQWIFTDLGLNLFIACVGMSAGPRAIHALQTTGGSIFIAGAILSLMPMIVGMIFGRLILKMDHVLLFGALTGSETATPALNALKEEAESPAPALAYAVPYAFGNTILTIWGTIIVHLVR